MLRKSSLPFRTVLLAALSSFVLLASNASVADDNGAAGKNRRAPIQLSVADREHLLFGMRKFLEAIQGILDGLATNKMQLISKSARSVGVGMLDDSSIRLGFKLPFDYVILSMETHNKFDDLARDASEIGTKLKVVSDLDEVVKNCTSCHSKYRFVP